MKNLKKEKKMTPVRWFWQFVRKYRFRLLGGLLMTTAVSALALITPYISGQIVDVVIGKKQYEKLAQMLIILLSATLARGLIRAGFLMVFESTSQNVLYDMRSFVYKKFLLQDFAFYNKNRTGDLMSRQSGDMDAARHFLAHTMYVTYENIILFVVALFMIFTVNVKLAFCMLGVLPFTALTTFVQMKKIRPVFQNIRNHFSSLNAFAQENISGNRVVKAFAKEDFEREKFDAENIGYMNAELKAARMFGIFIPIFEFLSNFLMVVLMLIGGIMVIQKEMSVGNLVTINGYLWMLVNPLKFAGWLVNDIQRLFASLDKIYATIIQVPSIKTPEKVAKIEKIAGKVEFRDVSYSSENEDIIQNISFCAERGQKIGIIGATGSGKSTIANLMCRFFDVTDGQVLIDGVDVRKIDLYRLRDSIGMAMQDVFLFSDTIESNIAYGRPDISFEEVIHAAKVANADDFIRDTPEGYDTIIGERGMGLSGGQKQRISLARALIKHPAIIILDDTTSAVDMETEGQIQDELKNLHSNATTFIIAHRISAIRDADLILVLDHGKILERGTHEELLEREGYYSTVFHHQYGEFDRAESGVKTDGQK